ncbi:MAG TPA: response regulator transcription factor [Polyangiaceae bacterium]|nr:response regulator transcription factor [Polyangiaceae bacterium]
MPNILIVDSEREPGSGLARNFEQGGFSVRHVESGAMALEAITKHLLPPDLIVLNMKLSDVPGTEVYRQLRALERTRVTPVIFVSVDGELERIVALELGADDCVSKPYRARETALRVRAVLRRTSPDPFEAPPRRVDENGLLIDVDAHEVWVDGREVLLTALEFRLLHVLVERRGRVQSRSLLLQDVWGVSADLMTRTVDTNVKRLREKLGCVASCIETVRGVGYRFERNGAHETTRSRTSTLS